MVYYCDKLGEVYHMETKQINRIIHCADLHLDSRMETHLTPAMAKERRQELFETFERMVSYAADNNVDAIIIAGDLFDTVSDRQTTIKERVIDIIKNNSDIEFFYINGNHDRKNDIVDKNDKPDNLKLFGEVWTTYSYGNIDITGIEPSTNAGIRPQLTLDENKVNIVIMHGDVSGRGEDDYSIDLAELKNKGIDYLALGHLHSYRFDSIDARGIYCYSGCLEGRGFDECGRCGFVIVEVAEQPVMQRFVSFSKRQLHDVSVDITGVADESSLVENIIRTLHISSEDLYRVTLTGDVSEELNIDINYLTRKFSNECYYIKFVNNTKLAIEYESYVNDISLKGEFLRTVMAQDLPQNLRDKIIVTGLKALAGREFD